MPSQMKRTSFAIRPGRQKSINRKVTVGTKEVRFVPVKSQFKPGAESPEERIQQAM